MNESSLHVDRVINNLLESGTGRLVRGKGTPETGACWMSMVAKLEQNVHWTDMPECVDPIIAFFCQIANDYLDEESRARTILPHFLLPVGTRSEDPEVNLRRDREAVRFLIAEVGADCIRGMGMKGVAERMLSDPFRESPWSPVPYDSEYVFYRAMMEEKRAEWARNLYFACCHLTKKGFTGPACVAVLKPWIAQPDPSRIGTLTESRVSTVLIPLIERLAKIGSRVPVEFCPSPERKIDAYMTRKTPSKASFSQML